MYVYSSLALMLFLQRIFRCSGKQCQWLRLGRVIIGVWEWSMEEIPGLSESGPQLTRHSSAGGIPDPLDPPKTSPHLRFGNSWTMHAYNNCMCTCMYNVGITVHACHLSTILETLNYFLDIMNELYCPLMFAWSTVNVIFSYVHMY